MKKKLIKNCVLSTILSAFLILVVSTILIIKEQPFTLRASNNVKITNENKTYVYPVGLPVGLYIETQGVLVVDNGILVTEDGQEVNPLKSIINPGDYIIKFNDEQIDSKDELITLIDKNGAKTVDLTINRNGNLININANPIKISAEEYKLGLWVRDDTQGIGTLTCVTTSNKFVGLGHGICDIDTLSILDINNGKIYNANIWGIKKGEQGEPGGLCGSIDYKDENIIGTINSNTSAGISGKVTADLPLKYNLELMEVARANQVKKGDAVIQIILDGKVEQYDIKILDVDKYSKEKCMLIEITDEDLLNKTNGIVQGMSGSPIIQDGKIIGAVTHVLVNDSTKGYGIFIDSMLEVN